MKYKRILIKLSGESLAGSDGKGLDLETVRMICGSIKETLALGAQVAIVVGGGNFWRGREYPGMERSRADHVGMIATIMNALAIADAFEKSDVPVRVMSALPMVNVCETYIRSRAIRHLEKGRVIILAAGTGNPYCSTDSAAALRAAEIDADIIFKATKVDGVYDSDPKKNPDAKKYDRLTFSEVVNQRLGVIDGQAALMCRECGIPMYVFDMLGDPENLVRAVSGENIGTIIEEE